MRFLFNIQPRYILLIGGIIAFFMIFGTIYRSHVNQQEILHVLQGKAFTLAETIEQACANIILESDLKELSNPRKTSGIGRFIHDIGNINGIEYIVLLDTVGIIAASDSIDQLSSFSNDSTLALLWNIDTTFARQITYHNSEVFETLRSLNIKGNRNGIIRIGLSMDDVRAIERQSEQRNIMRSVILFLITLLTIIALIANQNFRLSRQRIKVMETFTGNILEHMQDAVITLDADKKVSIFNKQAENLFGVDASQVLDRPFSEIARERFVCLNEIFFSDVSKKEINLICPDKSERTVSIAITRSEKNTTAVIRDLTETRRLQQEIERREKLSAMGELAAGVAHEIRNPLNAISMIAQRYEKEFSPRKNIREYLSLTQVIKKESMRVNGIIQQFLMFALPPKPECAKVSVQKFVDHVSTLFRSQTIERKVQFVSQCSYQGMVWMDYNTMTQAVLNILQNALDATPPCGSITLHAFEKDQSLIIEIQDTGKGIPKEQLEKIFNLYFSTKTKGSGMGLAITQQIVSQHRGSIRVKSEVSQGATFTISIPLLA